MLNNQPSAITIPMPVVPSVGTIQALDMLSQKVSGSNMSKFKKASDALFVMLYGLELGIPPMTALRGLYSVGGVPSTSGEMLLALIRRSGKVQIKITPTEEIIANQRCVVWMKRLDTGDEYTASFGNEDAVRAGVNTTNANYKKYPHAMYMWRAVSIAAKALCSDIVGALYTVEEIAPDTEVDEQGNPIGDIIEGTLADAQPAPSNVTTLPPQENQAQRWANDTNLKGLLAVVRGQTVPDMAMSEMARLAGIEKADDYAAWNSKYATGKEAGKAIVEAFNNEVSQQPPATPKNKSADQPQPPAWTDYDEHALTESISEAFMLSASTALDLVGKANWREFANRDAAFSAVQQAVITQGKPLAAKNIKADGKFWLLDTVVPVRMYGRELLRKAFADKPDLLAQIETWNQENVGETHELPERVHVYWKLAANGSYRTVESLTEDIPF